MGEILEFICQNCEETWSEQHLHEGPIKLCILCDLPLLQMIDSCTLPERFDTTTDKALA
jgi:hypothetical protein